MAKWFQKAIMEKPPYKLGWHKDMPVAKRLSVALSSRPKNWSPARKHLSVARALNALANVSKDPQTRRLARADAKMLFANYRSRKR